MTGRDVSHDLNQSARFQAHHRVTTITVLQAQQIWNHTFDAFAGTYEWMEGMKSKRVCTR